MNDIEVYMVVTRVLAFALICSVASPSVSFAAETLLDSAARAARDLARAQPTPQQAKPIVAPVSQKASFQQAPRGIESSGLRRRSKILIGLGVAAAFTGIALAIDSRVEDVTPSTKGERTTKPF